MRPKSHTEIARAKVNHTSVEIKLRKEILKMKIWRKNQRKRFRIAKVEILKGKYHFEEEGEGRALKVSCSK